MHMRSLFSPVGGLSLLVFGSATHAAAIGDVPWGAPTWMSQTLTLDHPGSVDEFGAAVAIDGTTLMIGAPLYPQNEGGNGGQGLVQVYTYAKAANEDWHRQAWAGALVLVSLVLVCSLLARVATRRLERMHVGR